MKHETLIDHSGDPAVEGGHVDLVGRLWPEQDLRVLSVSARTQAQDHSPHLKHAKMSRRSHRREAAEQYLSRMTAAHDSHHANYDPDAGILIAIAHRHSQNTHARATSW